MEVRLDTYLWAIRMYKSRTLAGEAIKGGRVKLNGETVKPSRMVKVGETYTLTISSLKKVIEVTGLVEKRGPFEIVKHFYIDRSPAPESGDHHPSAFFKTNVKREKGSGRPTKKDRRDIEGFGWE